MLQAVFVLGYSAARKHLHRYFLAAIMQLNPIQTRGVPPHWVTWQPPGDLTIRTHLGSAASS